MSVAYLASPIDFADDIETKRRAAANLAAEMGFAAVFDPSRAWRIGDGAEPSASLQRVNLQALLAADALLAVLPAGTPSLGVPLEIHHAIQASIPTLIVEQQDRPSWTLAYFARTGLLFRMHELDQFVAAVAGRTEEARR